MPHKYVLEICTPSYNSALAALRGGADRIELCSGLGEGGLTPSIGLIKAARALPCLRVNVLIRPRGGDFLYTPAEQAIMVDDIKAAADAGADGIVVGALRPDGTIDIEAMSTFIHAAGGLPVTFHRAFDVCADPLQALDDIIALGCARLLTSGQAATAERGLPLLRRLTEQAAGRIIIMPGCGVNPTNALQILTQSGATEIHASATKPRPSGMIFRHTGVSMGQSGTDEYSIIESNEEIIRQLRISLDLT